MAYFAKKPENNDESEGSLLCSTGVLWQTFGMGEGACKKKLLNALGKVLTTKCSPHTPNGGYGSVLFPHPDPRVRVRKINGTDENSKEGTEYEIKTEVFENAKYGYEC